LPNYFFRKLCEGVAEGEGFNQEWSEDDFRRSVAASDVVVVDQAIYVECFNSPVQAETQWALDLCADPESLVVGVVAKVPVLEGAKAVEAFLAHFRVGSAAALPKALKGARVIFLGEEMPPADACLDSKFLEGLAELEASGLHWEWCCQPCALPHVAAVCARFPNMQFVLDHCGHDDGEEDFDTWADALERVAMNANVVCKIGGCEKWGVKNPQRYVAKALEIFGIDRVLYESNWFVGAALGEPYDRNFRHLMKALEFLDWMSEEKMTKAFRANAKRVYRLE